MGVASMSIASVGVASMEVASSGSLINGNPISTDMDALFEDIFFFKFWALGGFWGARKGSKGVQIFGHPFESCLYLMKMP